MITALPKLQADLAEAMQQDAAADATLLALQKENSDLKQQIADMQKPKVVKILNIQSVAPETLWYEARSPGSPKTGPHGTITIVPGSPATADFHPMKLAGSESDNCYNLRRMYGDRTDEEKLILETATKFSMACDWMLDPLSNVQAAELDFQTRKKTGVVINIGPQLLPDGKGGWSMRGFDFINKGWVPLGVKANPKPGIPIRIQVDATCDDKTVQFTQILLDGVAFPVNFSHPTGISKDQKGNVITGAPYINAAYQLDATGDAKPYRATVNNFEVTYS